MHELSLAESLVEIIEDQVRKNGASKVTSVTVLIGEMSGVQKDAMEFCLPEATRNSVAENANFIIKEEKLEVLCQSCGKLSNPDIYFLACEHCESSDVRVTKGKDFKLLSLDVE